MRTITLFLLSLCISISAFAQNKSPYISKVFDFRPAPGQFINKLPEYEAGDTHEDMIRKVEECIVGDEKILVSLGGYGGYVLFGFDHMIENVPGKYDFRILGNAFYADANPNPDAPKEGGSCEPGIVMVSYDANGNGLPDDPWYELAGSEYHKPETIKKYQLTYYKPNENKVRTPNPDYPFLNDTSYIKWTSNQDNSGYVARNTFHSQSYYPLWLNDETMVFEGTKLADNYVDESGEGSYYVQYAYRWGYADNHPNTNDRSCFDISWAVDEDGNLVKLPGIHFVKVFTGVNQYCGWLGETSTEIMGAEDLHLLGKDINVPAYTEGVKLNHQSLELGKDEKAKLSATVFSSNPTIEVVTWESDNNHIVTVDENGLLTAVGLGTANVIVSAGNGKYKDSCTVTVTGDEIVVAESITLDKENIGTEKGETYQLTATILPENTTNKNVSWTSSNNAIATVDENGLVTAHSKGTATIQVATANGFLSAACEVTVTDNTTAVEQINALPETRAYYSQGTLYLINLEGYTCSLITTNGRIADSFHVHAANDTRSMNLHPGIYILKVQKQNAVRTFKIIIY